MVVKRQCFFLLHAADVAEFIRTNGKHTARAQCVGIAGAVRGKRGNADAHEHDGANTDLKFMHDIAATFEMTK